MQESKGVEIQAEIEKDVELCSTSYYYEDHIHFEGCPISLFVLVCVFALISDNLALAFPI